MTSKVKPPYFQVKIANCGTNQANGTYGIWKEKKAMKLLRSVIVQVARRFVGEDQMSNLIYWTSLSFLQDLSKNFAEKYPKITEEKVDKMINENWVIEG